MRTVTTNNNLSNPTKVPLNDVYKVAGKKVFLYEIFGTKVVMGRAAAENGKILTAPLVAFVPLLSFEKK
jgi:hypothetical protein